ncbi:MAG: DUF1553 domain-containing protein [Saprospiraceae bacterium]|nr:DUF1553 domain-containing protein [Saprospiraceae bacterium]
MMRNTRIVRWYCFIVLSCLLILIVGCREALPDPVRSAYADLPEQVDFNFHVRPILADRCYPCHGPDEASREAGLRLDREIDAFGMLASGGAALVAHRPQQSKAWLRIIESNPRQQMPPPESHLTLSAYEKALLHKWLKEGATWKRHWSFIPPEKPSVPTMESAGNEIDQFIRHRLLLEGLSPASRATKEELIRRLYFDLTGLPPTLEEIDAFVHDASSEAYAVRVEALLATRAHAERLAMDWLDVARFGDTQGMHVDPERLNWPWRDWVIRSFENNLPYDSFIVHQMAGDLLPNSTLDQRLATAFHRNHPTTSEGGVPDEEFRQKYVQDRTNTTATAFLGMTLECATCHDHKFDPISQEEYFEMTAFFNNMKELGMVNELLVKPGGGPVSASGPTMKLADPITAKEIDAIRAQRDMLTQARRHLMDSLSKTHAIAEGEVEMPKPSGHFPLDRLQHYPIEDAVIHRIQGLRPINKMLDQNKRSLACGSPEIVEGVVGNAMRSPTEMEILFLKEAGSFEINEPFSASAWIHPERQHTNQTILGTSGAMGNAWRGWDFFLDTLDRLTIRLVSAYPHNYVELQTLDSLAVDQWSHVAFTYDGTASSEGLHLYINGKLQATHVPYDRLTGTIVRRWRPNRPEWPDRPIMVFRSGRFHTGENGVFMGSMDEIHTYRQELSPLEMRERYVLDGGKAASPVTVSENLRHLLMRTSGPYQAHVKSLRHLVDRQRLLEQDVPEIMVLEDMEERRPTYVLDRGQYDAPTKEVFPATPKAILSFGDRPQNRLGLAQWLISHDNPLTARVVVNRYWQMIFGRGLVSTPEDFGIQGSLPSHPELLDWLAVWFMESGWNVRALLRLMVSSETYKQSSRIMEESLLKDPGNILLSRGPSYRYPAEFIRDNALAASGLLSRKVGGPSVKPYQPEGIWDHGSLVSGPYIESKGEDLYRRSMYTYIRRTAPHPAMTAFDAPNRLVCTVRRELTNTPLQALVLLNDPQYVEAARVLGLRMHRMGNELDACITTGFRLVTGQSPTEEELNLLKQQYRLAKSSFQRSSKRVEHLLKVGESESPVVDLETAAMTVVANTIMNFDGAYMKR